MRKSLYICLILALAPFLGTVNAQDLRITHLSNLTNLSFDLNSLYDFNIYERHRFGAGFYLTTPLHYDSRYGTLFQNSFYASAYAAYGTGDRAWKYGATAELRFPRNMLRKVAAGFRHDIEGLGLHTFGSYNILNTMDNASYTASRFSAINRLNAGLQADIPGPAFLSAELRLSYERLLFDANNMLFPARYDDDVMPRTRFRELHLHATWGDHIDVDLLAGDSDPDDGDALSALYANTDRFDSRHYARLLAQYSRTFSIGTNDNKLSVSAQGGYTFHENTPLSRRFDIGGTAGSHYFFRNALLTVRPNTFMADAFANACLHFSFRKPLWNTALSKPRPFVQLNAVYGLLRSSGGFAENAQYNIIDGSLPNPDDPANHIIPLTAPARGLLEPAAGIDYLLHWGIIDLGVAVAYQLTPRNSSYHLNNFFDAFAVMCVARMIFDFEL